jgi:FAD synthase
VSETVLRGVVVRGDQRGRRLGFPTANVEVSGAELPPDGVYAGWLEDEEGVRRLAAVSIGGRPTYYGDQGARLVEAHVLDFSGDLYGQRVTVGVGRVVRAQERFATVEELVAQMGADVAEIRAAGSR